MDIVPQLRRSVRFQSRIHEVMETCQVCYEEVRKEDMRFLACNHRFCKDCVKEHIESNIQQGKAITIRCM